MEETTTRKQDLQGSQSVRAGLETRAHPKVFEQGPGLGCAVDGLPS